MNSFKVLTRFFFLTIFIIVPHELIHTSHNSIHFQSLQRRETSKIVSNKHNKLLNARVSFKPLAYMPKLKKIHQFIEVVKRIFIDNGEQNVTTWQYDQLCCVIGILNDYFSSIRNSKEARWFSVQKQASSLITRYRTLKKLDSIRFY